MFLTPASRAGRRRSGQVPLTLNFGTISANPAEPTPGMALSIYGTWNNGAVTFDAPLFMNVTNTASASGSLLTDFQVGGTTIYSWSAVGTATINGQTSTPTQGSMLRFTGKSPSGSGSGNAGTGAVVLLGFNDSQNKQLLLGDFDALGSASAFFVRAIIDGSQNVASIDSVSGNGASAKFVNFINGCAFREFAASPDIIFVRQGNGILAHTGGATSQTLRLYNTSDTNLMNVTPTNFERGVFDWVTNTNLLTIGVQAGGTGSLRDMGLIAATKNIWMLNSTNVKVGTISGVVGQQHHDAYGGI